MLTSLVKVATCHVIVAAIFGICKTTWSVPQGSQLDRLLLRLTVCHQAWRQLVTVCVSLPR